MDVSAKFYVFCLCFACFLIEISGMKGLTWIPNNNIFNKQNWVDKNSVENCRRVEFAEYNTAFIDIDQSITAEEYLLPLTGELRFFESGLMKVVDHNSKIKTNCLKIKAIEQHAYLDPRNWDSEVSANPAVPDNEKLPCRVDEMKFPHVRYSALSDDGDHVDHHYVSHITALLHEETSLKRIHIMGNTCSNPAGCVCNEDEDFLVCPPPNQPACLNPIHPKGFCHPICGAYTTFKPSNGFILNSIKEALKKYSDIYTHVSKVKDDLIQLVFAEKEYSGDSVMYAEEFYDKLQEKSEEFRISDLNELKKSGARTSGDYSLASVFFTSLMFVLGLFGIIFFVYGDRRWLTNFRFRNPATYPLTSTYRARFSSRDDESGLIFDTQSIAGSVMNLRQSFDNPMFGEASAIKEKPVEEKIDTNIADESPIEKHDPLFDLKRLNAELQEEIGSDVVDDLQNSIHFKTATVNDISPLIEVEEDNED